MHEPCGSTGSPLSTRARECAPSSLTLRPCHRKASVQPPQKNRFASGRLPPGPTISYKINAVMIYPSNNPLLVRAFAWGVRWTMRRRFYGIFIRGLTPEVASENEAVIYCVNHTNWWDGFAIGSILSLFPKKRFYVAQHEKLLGRYRFLRWFGAFGLDIEGSAFPGLRYALKLLRNPENALWIFPQGVLVPQWTPIRVKPGALWLAKRSGAEIVPVAFRYEWMVESRPSLFIHFGEPLGPGATDADLEMALQSLYNDIGETLAPVDLTAYHALFTPRLSMNKLWDWLRCFDKSSFNPRNE
jgi:1-acyl-sn-glycerol-3-phosphate acyltransferase